MSKHPSGSGHFVSYGGGIHHSAIIGSPPESRDWTPDMPIMVPIIDPTARIEAFVTIDSGLHESTKVGARTFIMKACHLGHDVQVGEDCELAPHVVICGHCIIGNKVKIGVNACIRPFIRVGDGVRIGCGAVVVSDIPDGSGVWAGNPARQLHVPVMSDELATDLRDIGEGALNQPY